MVKPTLQTDPCPCGSNKAYHDCCQPYHNGALAPNAEALMRSRYSAYVHGLEDYLLATWHPETRPQTLNLEDESGIKWLGLAVKSAEILNEKNAIVEFVARYKIGGNKAMRLHEISKFELLERWFYHSGTL